MSPSMSTFGDLLGRWRGAAARGPAPQLRHRERLDDVVVGAGRKPAHALALLAARGQHDDRQRCGLRPRPQASAELDAGKAGQHPVEDDKIGRGSPAAGSRPRRRARRCRPRSPPPRDYSAAASVSASSSSTIRMRGTASPVSYSFSRELLPKLVVSPFGRWSAIGRPSIRIARSRRCWWRDRRSARYSWHRTEDGCRT